MDTLQWKRRLGKCYPRALLHRNSSRKIILLYHAVGNGPQALAASLFAEQIQWLQNHCEIVSLSELLTSSVKENVIQVAISFDDGYACLYDVVAPILSATKTPATVYINTGWMGCSTEARRLSDPNLGHYQGEAFLTWEEVMRLSQSNWEIGSHGVNHLDFTQVPLDIAITELKTSKQAIEARLNKGCKHFAYTWGKHTKQLRKQVVAKVGYQYAAAAHHAALTQKEDPLAFPRLNIDKDYSMDDFKAIVLGKWDYLNVIQRVKRLL